MSPTRGRGAIPSSCFPRVSGDEPDPGAWRYPVVVFSPRERG